MKQRDNSPKKGTPYEYRSQVRQLAVDFVAYCKVYQSYFDVFSRNVSKQATNYLAGLLMKAPRKNMERMEEYVKDFNYQSQQQFITDSPWNHTALQERITKDVNNLLGSSESVFCIDDSSNTKKGKCSVGVARQWNGRIGKTDNCQVGVFSSLVKEHNGSLVDYRLYLPQEWIDDEHRCNKAKIPIQARVFKTKPELALEMLDSALKREVQFGWVAADGFYGNIPSFARGLNSRNVRFMLDIHSDQTTYHTDPDPYLPRRKKLIGPKFKKLCSRSEGVQVKSLLPAIELDAWKTVTVRESTKGTVLIDGWRKRVWLWDGVEKDGRQWWLVITKEKESEKIKYFVSNADESVSLETLVRVHAQRFWIERCFQDAKTSVGMADYQVRLWNAWQHHMCLVLLAMLFMLQERVLLHKEVELLSCQDIIELLDFYLPRNDCTEEDVFNNLARRHKKRQDAIDFAYRKQQNKVLKL